MSYRSDDQRGQPVIVAFNNHVFGLHPKTGARLWRFDVDKGFGGGRVVRIAVAGDMVYALASGVLACIHAPTGQVLGQVVTRALGQSGTLVAGNEQILVAAGGEVQCFSRNGQLLWEDTFKGEGASEVALAFEGTVVQADHSS